MSANQIPAPGARTTALGSESTHSCPECWRNGGGGHRLVADGPFPALAVPDWAAPKKTAGRTR